MKLNDADSVYVGATAVDKVYAGANLVWSAVTGHLWWRFTLDKCQYDGYTMAEVQFRTEAGVPLTPSGGTPSAADTYPGLIKGPDGVNPLGTYGPEQVLDGSALTMWSSNAPAAPVQWWGYTYPTPQNIVEIAITARGDGYNLFTQTPIKITPQWSDDGVTWTSLPQMGVNYWTAEGQTQVFRAIAPSKSVLVSCEVGADRNDIVGEVGVRLGIGPADLTINWIGMRCHTGNSGPRTLNINEFFADTPVATATVDLTGMVAGEWVWASISPVTLLANGYYTLMMVVTGASMQPWNNVAPSVMKSPEIANHYYCYRPTRLDRAVSTNDPNTIFGGAFDIGWN
jgi:F5/8 type C domain-containing protein